MPSRLALLRGSSSASQTSLHASILPMNTSHNENRARQLAETKVNSDGSGNCHVRDSLKTPSNGDESAKGIMFSVKAKQAIQIQAFEFVEVASSTGIGVQIYGKAGSEFSDNPSDWTELTSTTAIESPDGIGSIVPRADMSQSISLQAGEEWSFFVTLATFLQLESTLTDTGTAYQSNEYLQLNVGASVPGESVSLPRTSNRAFLGTIHYQTEGPCTSFLSQSTLVFPFAAPLDADQSTLNQALSDRTTQLLEEEADLVRWQRVHGLALTGTNLASQGTMDDCTQYGFSAGCAFYNSELGFQHYESLGEKELTVELMVKVNARNGVGTLEDDLSMVYIGDSVYSQAFIVTLVGVPDDTILIPVQRQYLESVTYDYLNDYSDADVYRVQCSQVSGDRRHLRGKSGEISQRQLRETGAIQVSTTIYGVGQNREAFVTEVERALTSSPGQYQDEVIKQQYRPGEINDGENNGDIFEGIFRQTVKIDRAGNSGSTDDGITSNDIQIIVYSAIIGLCCAWLAYRVCVDCFWVKNGAEIETMKLSDQVAEDTKKSQSMDFSTAEQSKKSHQSKDFKTTPHRPELGNMDKPRLRPSQQYQVDEMDRFADRFPDLNNTKTPPGRCDRRTKSADGVWQAMPPGPKRAKRPTGKADRRTKSAETVWGAKPVRSTEFVKPKSEVLGGRSFDGDGSFANTPRRPSSMHSHYEPSRGVDRVKSTDARDMAGDMRRPNSAHNLSDPTRGVGRTRSSDAVQMGRPRRGIDDMPTGARPRRGADTLQAPQKKKKKKKKVAKASAEEIGATKKKKKKKKKKPPTATVREPAGVAKPKSAQSSKLGKALPKPGSKKKPKSGTFGDPSAPRLVKPKSGKKQPGGAARKPHGRPKTSVNMAGKVERRPSY